MKTKKTAKPITTETHQELENQLKRALADYQNLERRVEEERKLLSQLSAALLIEKLLPVLDNLENAQEHISDEGLDMIIKQFKNILISEGVTEIEAAGLQFDPKLHEATEVVEGENDNTVVKVERKGYKINDKVIRPAQVVVERKGDSGQARMTEEPPLTSHPEPKSKDQIKGQVENDTGGNQI